ncbi:MAG: hypothetical protein ABIJ48_09090 [Actinomycetota bacterium]
MRRSATWVISLFLLAALTAPAAAAPADDSGSILGTITDAGTGLPFSGAQAVVDAFNVNTMERTRVWVTDPDGDYLMSPLAPGDYKVRYRVWDGSGLIRYRWFHARANFDGATVVTVDPLSVTRIDVALAPMPGARVSGTISERGSGAPLGGDCFYVELFEASGISLGVILWADPISGSWESMGNAPAGKLKALAGYEELAWPTCADGPTHLDTWYGGASGHPLRQANLSAHPATFATANLIRVRDGIDAGNVDIAMPVAPACRGRQPTIFGTTLADTIAGTGARDIVAALGGHDAVNGLSGNDLLCGNAGDDTLVGGAGPRDTAVGGRGTDTCTAERTFGCP